MGEIAADKRGVRVFGLLTTAGTCPLATRLLRR
jgi:hypothetical protein